MFFEAAGPSGHWHICRCAQSGGCTSQQGLLRGPCMVCWKQVKAQEIKGTCEWSSV